MSSRSSQELAEDSMLVDQPTRNPSAIASGSTNATISPPNAGDDATTPRVKLKRNRLTISCHPCHVRKQKCDRNQPCQRCVKRGDIHACVYSTPRTQPKLGPGPSVLSHASSTIPPTDDALSHRVAHLESLVNATITGLGNTSIPGLGALLQIVNASNATVSHQAQQPPAVDAPLPESAVQVAAAALGQLSRQTLDRDQTGGIDEPGDQYADGAAMLHSILPERSIVDGLVKYFFESSTISLLHPFLHRSAFSHTYTALTTGRVHFPNDFVGLLAAMCAVALQFLPNDFSGIELLRNHSSLRVSLQRRLSTLAQTMLLSMGKTQFTSIVQIQGQCLLSLYYANENDFYNCNLFATVAVRNAQAFGLHREAPEWNMKPQDAEIRRRLWGCIYNLDRSTSFMLRQPYLIHEKHCNAAMPSNVDDSVLNGDGAITNKPISDFTDYTFHIAQIQLAKLFGDIWEQCLNVTLPTYAMVMSLDVDICGFQSAIPSQLRVLSSSESTSTPFSLKFQAMFLDMQILNARLTLLRNCIFKGSGHSEELDPRVNEAASKIEEFHNIARNICAVLCKQIIAIYYSLRSLDSTRREHLRWTTIPTIVTNTTLTMTIIAITQSTSRVDEDIPRWIALAEDLVRESNHHNAFHPNISTTIHALHKRALEACNGSIHSQPSASPLLPSETMLRILGQERESVVKKLASEEAHGWASVQATVYANTFPSVVNIGDTNGSDLLQFCDICVGR